MKILSDILTHPLTDEEFLDKKRHDLKEKCEGVRAEISELAKSADFKAKTLEAAEMYMQNLYVLPGTGGKPFFVGNPPKWSEKPVEDEEYLYSLNRLYDMPYLCRAYVMTGERRYAEKAVENVMSWIDGCPRPSLDMNDEDLVATFQGLTPWRLLECGIRAFESWSCFYTTLILSDVMTPDVHARYVSSLYEHAEVISKISPLAWPDAAHNHYLHEMLGLLIIACRFPELDRAAEWREQAAREMFRTVKAQIDFDGSQVEACANYHDICLDMIAQGLGVCKEYSIDVPDDIKALVERAYEHSVWTVTPVGYITSVGDSYMLPKYIPSLVEGYYKREGNVGPYAAILPLMDRQSFAGVPDCEFDKAEKTAQSLPGGLRNCRGIGQIIGRTGWTRDDAFFLLNCRSPVFNGHAQQDPMSFSLVMDGSDVVTDPSYLTYNDDEHRRKYKSIKYHSSLTFSEREPYEYVSRWEFTEQKRGSTEKAYSGNGFLAADASHDNYAPAEHRRLCALIDKDTFVVVDDVYNPGAEEINLRFHMGTPDYQLTAVGATNGRVNVLLPEGEKCVLSANKSVFTDIELPTAIIKVKVASLLKRDIYVSVITMRGDVSAPIARREGDVITVTFSRGEKTEGIEWKFADYCKRI